MAGASRIWKMVKSNLLREYDVHRLGPAYDYSRILTTCVVFRAVDRSEFCHLSPSPTTQLLNSYHIISAVTALKAAAQLEVKCLMFRVLLDEHLAVDPPAWPFFRLACCCWLRLQYRAILLAAASQYNLTSTGWRRW